MDPLTAIAASGMRARMESLEMLANNVANASTGGYKADREFYSLYTSPEADCQPTPTMPLIEKPWIDLSQGTLHDTGSPFDLALSGKGFFAVDGPKGALYTRNGNFSLAKDGRVVTAEGYPLRAEKGVELKIESTRPFEIATDGTVHQDGNVIGQLELVDFDTAAGLAKQGNNYFRVADPAGRVALPANTTVGQGRIEISNTGTAEAAVRLISVLRQFEMMQKAVALGAEMNRHAVEEVARVGS
jgi:flagellar basal body rod protein FlgG